MTTIAHSGPDIVRNMRKECAGHGLMLDDSAKVGRVASWTKRANVEAPQGTAGQVDIVCVATTDDVDLDGEVVLPDGADWTYLQKNKSIFLDHSYGSAQAVAKLRSVYRKDNGWGFRATLIGDEMDENRRVVYNLAKAGLLAASIGFTVKEAGTPTPAEQARYPGVEYVIRKWQGIEISYTAMPCNVACRTSELIYGDDGKRAGVVDLLTKSHTPAALMESMGLAKAKRVIMCG